MKKPLNVLFLTDGIDNPASRYRCEQFFDHFEGHGVRCTMRYAYGSLYNSVFDTRLGPLYKLVTRARRAAHTLAPALTDFDRYDVVFLQRTAFPQTALPERLLARRRGGLVFDFDDAIFLGPGGTPSPSREKAFHEAAQLADHLIAGNRFLRDQANHPEKTTVIPTVIDTDRYVPIEKRPDGPPVVGWMGTASNFPSLSLAVPALREILSRHPEARVRIVSNADFEPLMEHPQVEQIRWSADREIELLQSFDIGLMPLEDTLANRGKCAFKMIQYMAVGIPVVVSAVGANLEVAEGAELGHIVRSDEEWVEALDELLTSDQRRERMGEAGRTRAEEAYSVRAVISGYIELFNRLAA